VDWSALALAAFAVGTVGNSIKSVPQFVRTAVRGRVAGLSTTAVWLAFAANVLWLCFGLAIQDWLFVSLGIVQTALVTGTLGRYVVVTGWSRSVRHALLALLACGAFGALAVTGTALALETLGAGLGVVIGAPQLLYLWRRRRTATDVSGVSQGEYVLVIVAQVAWTVYWLTQGHPVAAAGAAWGGTARAVTFILLRSQAARAQLVAP
jgi:uncharacterized protein with PQ loop repeat